MEKSYIASVKTPALLTGVMYIHIWTLLSKTKWLHNGWALLAGPIQISKSCPLHYQSRGTLSWLFRSDSFGVLLRTMQKFSRVQSRSWSRYKNRIDDTFKSLCIGTRNRFIILANFWSSFNVSKYSFPDPAMHACIGTIDISNAVRKKIISCRGLQWYARVQIQDSRSGRFFEGTKRLSCLFLI